MHASLNNLKDQNSDGTSALPKGDPSNCLGVTNSLRLFSVNYLFFGAYFLMVLTIHLVHVFLVQPAGIPSYFFATYALAQCALEVCFLGLVVAVLRQILPRRLYRALSALLLLLFTIHLIDFFLVRLMNMSFWFALQFVLQQTGKNFIEMLYASSVPLWIWAGGGLFIFLFLGSGVALFCWSERCTDRRPYLLSYPMLIAVMGVLFLFLMSWERLAPQMVHNKAFERYQKTLPWKMTWITPPYEEWYLKERLTPPKEEEMAWKSLDSRAFALTRRPDIYLFVIESLREDYIIPEYAPHLSAFRDNNIHFDLAFSNSNSTNGEWFSIFSSKQPFYLGANSLTQSSSGSVPLRWLKKMGYQIHVLSSARLGYYQMDRLIFGEGLSLTDSFFAPDEEECEEPYQKDQETMGQLIRKMGESPPASGRVFIVFLDATHHDYSWPPEEFSLFRPFEDKVHYLKMAWGCDEMNSVRNRYRNALCFVDSLIGQFREALDRSPRGKEAVVVMTADHAEEFGEQGHLFHATALTHQQLHVPLYYKFGENQELKPRCSMTSHIDIFPSLFHYLIGEDLFHEVLQGESIFREDRWPYVVSGRFNANRPPFEFSIHNGQDKMIARFDNEQEIFKARKLKILAIKDRNEENVECDSETMQHLFREAVDHLCTP